MAKYLTTQSISVYSYTLELLSVLSLFLSSNNSRKTEPHNNAYITIICKREALLLNHMLDINATVKNAILLNLKRCLSSVCLKSPFAICLRGFCSHEALGGQTNIFCHWLACWTRLTVVEAIADRNRPRGIFFSAWGTRVYDGSAVLYTEDVFQATAI